MGKERCSYWCMEPGYWREVQVLKVPRTTEESYWEVCYINLTVIVSDTYKDVYCDQKTNGERWTVLMRRFDGSVNFNREWEDYKRGFGNLTGEFWAGNEFMHKITTEGPTYLLRVELRSYEGEFIFAEYSNFSVGPESDNYRLHVSGYLPNSTAGDSLSYHSGMMFTTASHDNDIYGSNCAQRFSAPWWFVNCHDVLLTGILEYPPCTKYAEGITWKSAWGFDKFANYTRMMIRPFV
ncbi:hypothetical protein LSH36_839g05099 [Paralvinella palmiformis]|uniref:Fibrinogen C-terminal domain-containing protein n=1 Tax=Paralvinella palmiformis TaxID=53620 RepID=A0AAD9J0N4_9ANNE|nr:hypothetical protein LSH36_839g05099 [Paralvinella palmiformis]